MYFYLKEWPDDTVTLMTQDGRVIWSFASMDEARDAAEDFSPAPRNRSIVIDAPRPRDRKVA